MNYPTRILPQSSYKSINCDLSSHYLIRFTKTNDVKEIINPETGFVKCEHICTPRQHAADLSTSLLGIFEVLHIQIELTDAGNAKYNDYCEPNATIDPPILHQDYLLNNSRHFWVIHVKDIINAEVDYTKSNLPFKATCIIQHTPMKWNFWHFSIRWKTENGFWHELTEKEQEKLAKRLGNEVRAYISKYAKVHEPNYTELDESFYLR
jgi:hypothetical protein